MSRINRSRFSVFMLVLVTFALLVDASAEKLAISPAEPDFAPIRDGADVTAIDKERELGAAYFTGHGVAADGKQAAYWYQKAANAGDPVAELQLGYLYQVGLGVPVDMTRAVHWYQLAAAGGLTNAKVNLGVAYMWGLGVKRDQALAGQLFKEAATKGNGLAACYLGDMYLFGTGVKQDKETARKWYETGIRLHDPQAEFDFVSHFLMSDQRDLSKAAQMLRESAKAGYVPAMYALGHILVNHPALSRSPQEAIPLLELSAGAGTWRSSVLLGILARDGRVIPPDTRSAYYRFKVATLQGGDDAERLLANDLRILSTKLGAEQTAAADIEAGKWSNEHRNVLQFVYNGGDNRSGEPSFALTLPTDGAHAGQVISSPPM